MNIDGREIAKKLNDETRLRAKQLLTKPLLVDIVVGNDPASLSYVRIKEKKAYEVGFNFELLHLPETSSTDDVIKEIESLSSRADLSGLIVQLPLPSSVDTKQILNHIPERIDVDLLNESTSKKFYSGQQTLIPPTAGAIVHILDSLNEDFTKKNILVLGQGELVGKPTVYLLKNRGFNIQTADSSTENIAQLLAECDCLITGVGKSGLVKGGQLKQDVIVIDAGTSEASGTIAGDVDYASVFPKAKYITPVPGGVGPVTVSKLLENVITVTEQS